MNTILIILAGLCLVLYLLKRRSQAQERGLVARGGQGVARSGPSRGAGPWRRLQAVPVQAAGVEPVHRKKGGRVVDVGGPGQDADDGHEAAIERASREAAERAAAPSPRARRRSNGATPSCEALASLGADVGVRARRVAEQYLRVGVYDAASRPLFRRDRVWPRRASLPATAARASGATGLSRTGPLGRLPCQVFRPAIGRGPQHAGHHPRTMGPVTRRGTSTASALKRDRRSDVGCVTMFVTGSRAGADDGVVAEPKNAG